MRASDRSADMPVWRVLDDRLSERFALPYVMVTAPRWNTHAHILTAGPFHHKAGTLRFDGPTGGNWKAWSMVIYDAVTGRTVDFLSSGKDATKVELPTGAYRVGLRVYEPDGALVLPEIAAAASTVVPARTIEARRIDTLEQRIFGKTSRFYRLLNAPVTQRLASTGGGVDDDLVEAYLPAGNPETLFVFGPVSRGSTVTIGAETISPTAQCYLTVYNTASFPVASQTVRSGERMTHACAESGSFLIRIVPSEGSAEDNRHLLDAIEVDIGS